MAEMFNGTRKNIVASLVWFQLQLGDTCCIIQKKHVLVSAFVGVPLTSGDSWSHFRDMEKARSRTPPTHPLGRGSGATPRHRDPFTLNKHHRCKQKSKPPIQSPGKVSQEGASRWRYEEHQQVCHYDHTSWDQVAPTRIAFFVFVSGLPKPIPR